ncbi:MAG TPA: hypothetical protein PKY35_05010 [Candidatus Hydrogenedentes bacterium]|nr:hypothetical protein [Candidatus Hydrogenedentota bacterium]HOL76370.1 hypothetical protein [Candidatus Hydrogenedentota bacterium]HPO85408.1 hypothetical protein [Candidatus Hydrogenedentota bacterium]
MVIKLNDYRFDPATIQIKDQIEEIGGRNRRRITLSGIIADKPTVEEVEQVLDAIYYAASHTTYDNELSLREGRRLWVRCCAGTRRVGMEIGFGAFELLLESRDLTEESIAIEQQIWAIASSGATFALSTIGSAPALPTIVLTAAASLVAPSFSDGERRIVFPGTVSPGATLCLDASQGKVILNTTDVTPYVVGKFPRIVSPETVWTYSDESSTNPVGEAVISYHHRWW